MEQTVISADHNLPLSLLETFVTFSKEKTTAKTAKLLGLTQPTVSRQLIQLEDALPQKIFRLKGRNKILTEYGEALARELEDYFQELSKTVQKVNQEYLEPTQLKIKIAARQEILECYLENFDFPGSVELLPMGTKEVVQQIQAQTVDVAISHDLSFSSDYIRKKFFASTIKIIIPKKWFSSKPSLQQWLNQAHNHPIAH